MNTNTAASLDVMSAFKKYLTSGPRISLGFPNALFCREGFWCPPGDDGGHGHGHSAGDERPAAEGHRRPEQREFFKVLQHRKQNGEGVNNRL